MTVTSPATFLFTVDAIGSPEAVVAQSWCRKIMLRENNQDAATLLPFQIRIPDATSPAVRCVAGATLIIKAVEGKRPFFQGDIVGYIETLSGSAVFAQTEDVQ
jgi:hypothetical protein